MATTGAGCHAVRLYDRRPRLCVRSAARDCGTWTSRWPGWPRRPRQAQPTEGEARGPNSSDGCGSEQGVRPLYQRLGPQCRASSASGHACLCGAEIAVGGADCDASRVPAVVLFPSRCVADACVPLSPDCPRSVSVLLSPVSAAPLLLDASRLPVERGQPAASCHASTANDPGQAPRARPVQRARAPRWQPVFFSSHNLVIGRRARRGGDPANPACPRQCASLDDKVGPVLGRRELENRRGRPTCVFQHVKMIWAHVCQPLASIPFALALPPRVSYHLPLPLSPQIRAASGPALPTAAAVASAAEMVNERRVAVE